MIEKLVTKYIKGVLRETDTGTQYKVELSLFDPENVEWEHLHTQYFHKNRLHEPRKKAREYLRQKVGEYTQEAEEDE